jgi:DNA-binding MarR family transcriptional regulator
MDTSYLENNLYWHLLRVAISAKHLLMDLSEKYDLTVMQLYTLCMLDDNTSVPMSALSEYLHCDASNITGIVDRLFTRNLIRREENPKDRRVKMITITPQGVEI